MRNDKSTAFFARALSGILTPAISRGRADCWGEATGWDTVFSLVVKTTSGCKLRGARESVLGLQLLGKAVEMNCDLLWRFQRRQMPDVPEHLKNGARDSRQEFAFEGLDGVDLVLVA